MLNPIFLMSMFIGISIISGLLILVASVRSAQISRSEEGAYARLNIATPKDDASGSQWAFANRT